MLQDSYLIKEKPYILLLELTVFIFFSLLYQTRNSLYYFKLYESLTSHLESPLEPFLLMPYFESFGMSGMVQNQ